MELKKRKRTIYISFITTLLLTLIVFAVLFYLDTERGKVSGDDIFSSTSIGSALDIVIAVSFLLPHIVAEFDIFYTVRYFLLQNSYRSKGRDFINGSCCAISVLMAGILLTGFYYAYIPVLVLLWLWVFCYGLFQIAYFIVTRVKGKRLLKSKIT